MIVDLASEIFTVVEYDKKEFFIPEHIRDSESHLRILPDSKKIIWTNGVATDITVGGVVSEYKKYKSKLSHIKYPIVVMLAGNAEDEDGSILLYTKEEARKLAEYIKRICVDRSIVVLNGPRTGKHSELSEYLHNSHRDGNLDKISSTFIYYLQECGLELKKNLHIFDFQFGKENMYRAWLGRMSLDPKIEFFIPGESNSTIADANALQLQQQSIIYTHSAMNKMHHKHMDFALKKQGFKKLDSGSEIALCKREEMKSAVEQIALAILK